MLAYRFFHRMIHVVHYTTLHKLLSVMLGCVLLVRCVSDTPTPTPIRLALSTAVPSATPTAPPATLKPEISTPAPTNTFAPTPASQAAPELLIERDTEHAIQALGPLAPSNRWLVTRHAGTEPLFALHSLTPSPRPASEPRYVAGQPFGWSADSALLLYTAQVAPATLLALEPTSGVTATVFVSEYGPIKGFAWLQSALIYATEQADRVRLIESDGASHAVVAQLADRVLLPNGLVGAPDGRSVALLVASTDSTTPTVELYRFDQLSSELVLLDQAAAGADFAEVTVEWNRYGGLAYDLGAGLRQYEPALNYVVQAGFAGRPLSWNDQGLLIRQAETGRLLRWQPDGTMLPFGTTESPVVVQDALTLNQSMVLFLINGEVWQSSLP